MANASDLIPGIPSLKKPNVLRKADSSLSYSNDVVSFKTICLSRCFKISTFQHLASSYIFGELPGVHRHVFTPFLEFSNELKQRFLCSLVILKSFVGFICEIMLFFFKILFSSSKSLSTSSAALRTAGSIDVAISLYCPFNERSTAAPCLIFEGSVTCCHNATSRLRASYVFSLKSGGHLYNDSYFLLLAFSKKTSRDRPPKSAPYLTLKNSKKTSAKKRAKRGHFQNCQHFCRS